MRKHVDFFLVGAAKCGTSAMFEYLIQHPEIYIPKQKELHFFGMDLHYSIPRITKVKYRTYFEKADENKLWGDCSVSYLLSKSSAREIRTYNPNAKVIIMVRHPLEMLQSLHAELVFDGMEFETNLVKALTLEEGRKNGQYLPRLYSIPREFLYYSESVALYTQIKRFIRMLSREQILILHQKDLIEKPDASLKQVTDFLGVQEYDFQLRSEVNPYKKVRFSSLNYFQNQLSEKGKSFFRSAIPSKRLRKYIFNKVWELNSVKSKKSELPAHIKVRLEQKFKTEIEGLEELLGKKL